MTQQHGETGRPGWMIYGAAGYSGMLVAEAAVKGGLAPVLAGRGDNIRALAGRLGLECRTFDVEQADGNLDGISLVLNCAGPFSATAAPMIAACLRAGAHYLDITGEIDVFEHAAALDGDARAAGVVLCPGVGFDVVPTDCVALALKEALPDATDLALAFDIGSGLSRGTANTTVEGLAKGGRVRVGGRIVAEPIAARIRRIDVGGVTRACMSLAWGDVATAWHTTGIPNIVVFTPAPGLAAPAMRMLGALRPALARPAVQRWLKRMVERHVKGPEPAARARCRAHVWGEARNAKGDIVVARVDTQNGYDLTAHAALAIVGKLRRDAPASGGYWTPARLCGRNLVEMLPGSSRIVVTRG